LEVEHGNATWWKENIGFSYPKHPETFGGKGQTILQVWWHNSRKFRKFGRVVVKSKQRFQGTNSLSFKAALFQSSRLSHQGLKEENRNLNVAELNPNCAAAAWLWFPSLCTVTLTLSSSIFSY